MGNTPECASTKSFGDVLRVPVMASVAIRWIFWSPRNAPAEPVFLVYPAGLVGGVYQMSMPYIIFGSATARYNWRISLALTPVDGLVSLLNWSIHLVALAVARCACSFHRSWASI